MSKTKPLALPIQEQEFLVIVESPSKCKKIQDYLNRIGNGSYKVIASKGHIRTISGLKSIHPKLQYKIDFAEIETKRGHIDQMKTQIMYYPKNRIILATDNDREGEAIAFHICDVFGIPIETTKRILFNEITYEALRDAIMRPTVLNMDLVKSQHARQVLDVFIGFKISPLLWKHVFSSRAKSLSAGRCQTPALRLVYDNYMESAQCKTKTKYVTTGVFEGLIFSLNCDYDNETDLISFLQASKSIVEYPMRIIERPIGKRCPPLPLNTSRMLQLSHMSPKICMDTAQKLYQEGLITYHRTESKKYCKEFLGKVRGFILGLYKDESYVHEDLGKLSNEGDAMPHEAIRVTDLSKRSLDSSDTRMSSLYKIIWNNTVESCMSMATLDVYHIELNSALGTKFTHVLEIPKFLGWMRLRNESLGEKDRAILLGFKNKTTIKCDKIESNIQVTGFHSHYTESSLIQKLEDLGIGRPSTFAMFVETIQERGYVKKGDIDGISISCSNYLLEKNCIKKKIVEKVFGKEQGKLKIEPLGILCIDFLLKYFDDIFDYSYTKNIEDVLDKKSDPWYSICDSVLDTITKKIKNIKLVKKKTFPIDESHEIIFQSFGPCVLRHGKDGEDEFLPIKPQHLGKIEALLLDSVDGKMNLDISIEDLVVFQSSNLGKDQESGSSVFIKTGPYGYYLEFGGKQKSLKDYPIESIGELDLESALGILHGNNEEGEDGGVGGESNKMILRHLTPEMSIRRGKFGSYIYYKKPDSKVPKFISLKGFDQGDYLTCETEIVIKWAEDESIKPKKTGWRGGGGRGRGGGRSGGRGGRGRGRGRN